MSVYRFGPNWKYLCLIHIAMKWCTGIYGQRMNPTDTSIYLWPPQPNQICWHGYRHNICSWTLCCILNAFQSLSLREALGCWYCFHGGRQSVFPLSSGMEMLWNSLSIGNKNVIQHNTLTAEKTAECSCSLILVLPVNPACLLWSSDCRLVCRLHGTNIDLMDIVS